MYNTSAFTRCYLRIINMWGGNMIKRTDMLIFILLSIIILLILFDWFTSGGMVDIKKASSI
jgi:hypothetical protein